MSRSSKPNRSGSRGFSLLEVIIALCVLVVGVSAMAALSAAMLTKGRQSKYVSLAGTLASEKIEDLNRWRSSFSAAGVDQSDPQICVNSGDTSEGTLSPPATPPIWPNTNTITCNGVTESVSYFDRVSIDMTDATDCPNPADGCFAESTSITSGGTTTYYTTYHSPDGTIPGFASGTTAGTRPAGPLSATTAPTNITFLRTWVIEPNPFGVQGRRITVLVTQLNAAVPVSFQMSVVRP